MQWSGINNGGGLILYWYVSSVRGVSQTRTEHQYYYYPVLTIALAIISKLDMKHDLSSKKECGLEVDKLLIR
jgi:hypothetical protein